MKNKKWIAGLIILGSAIAAGLGIKFLFSYFQAQNQDKQVKAAGNAFDPTFWQGLKKLNQFSPTATQIDKSIDDAKTIYDDPTQAKSILGATKTQAEVSLIADGFINTNHLVMYLYLVQNAPNDIQDIKNAVAQLPPF